MKENSENTSINRRKEVHEQHIVDDVKHLRIDKEEMLISEKQSGN